MGWLTCLRHLGCTHCHTAFDCWTGVPLLVHRTLAGFGQPHSHGELRLMTASLLGVDVGFSMTRRSTGLAWRVDGEVGTCLTGSNWSARSVALPPGVTFALAALDAPLVPKGTAIPKRGCEAVFYRGAFWNRCRPGMSHHGRGLGLRAAGSDAAHQFSAVVQCSPGVPHRPIGGTSMVEAFPNTFLGVLLPASAFTSISAKGKQPKSDLLYHAAVEQDVFARLLDHLGWAESSTASRLAGEGHHDNRAALVCLLTAGFAWAGTATVVGDDAGGWFWLPPLELWADWARLALRENLARARERGHPGVTVIGQSALSGQ